MKTSSPIFILTHFVASVVSCKKEHSPAVVTPETYFPKVKAIIQNNCLSCHSSSGTWEGRPTAFDTDDAIADQAGAIKAAIADPVTPTNKRMPQGSALAAADSVTIVKWFNKGGKLTD